ncbi:hypothetical protein M9H77_22100 [Catharanthus roseus]|uniref:Uncharacterized protein n=1 Tax=Catharanthus roseus TaxID=4058 RepID=A0ACC0AS08_CATRO|nr:hypothetical protein M9H77_22100 [Catharanthus roseus]
MVSIGGTLGCTLSQHNIQQTYPPVPDWGARGVKRGTRRLPGHGARDGHSYADPGHEVERCEGSGGGRPPLDPFDNLDLDMSSFSLGLTPPSQSIPGGSGTLRFSPSGFRVCPISLTTPYIFRVFFVSCTSSSGYSRFIYTASAYIACIFI